MPFQPYIPTRVVSLGGASGMESSELLRMMVTVTSLSPLIWDATGYRLENIGYSAESALGGELTIELPVTDSPGWRDPATNSVIDVSAPYSYTHLYTAKVSFVDTTGTQRGTSAAFGPFPLPAGDGTVVDLDSLLPVGGVPGGAVNVPDLWSALVEQAEAAAAAAAASAAAAAASVALADSTVAAQVTSGPLTGAALADAFAPLSSARPGTRFVFLGDSITAGSDSGVNVTRGDAWVVYAAFMSKWRIGYVHNAGVGGDTTAMMLARFDTDVTPYSPTAVTIAGGMNDATSISITTYRTNIEAIVAKVRSISAVPILVTVTPSINASRGARIAQYNTWLRRYAAAESIPLLDFWDIIVDPATSGLAAAYDQGDGIHPNAIAHQLMGENAAAQLASILPSTSAPLSMSNVDFSNILTNSLFLTDTNSDGLSDDWTVYTTPPSGYAFTRPTNAAMKGNAQRVTHTATTAATWLRQIKTAGFSVGDTIQLSGIVESSGVPATIQLQFGGSTGNINIYPLNITRPTGPGAFTVEFVVPPATINLQLFLKVAAGTGWADFGQMAIRNLTTLGAI